MKRIFLPILICLPQILFAQKVEGVVTYFFNDNFGYKPDVGAKVYIFPDSNNASFIKIDSFGKVILKVRPGTIDSFLIGKYAWSHYQFALNTYKSTPKRKRTEADENELATSLETCKHYGITAEADMKSLDNRAFEELFNIEHSKNTIKTMVDGAGRYSIDVPKGSYYVFIISAGRKSLSLSEASGKVYYKRVELKSNETQNLNAKFEVY